MKKTILSFIVLLLSFISTAQCVRLYVNEHLLGSPICRLTNGDYIEICEDENEVHGCPYDFYVYNKGWSNGNLTYELSLDKGRLATHYLTLMVNTQTQRFGFIQQGQTAMYSYYTEGEMDKKRSQQANEQSLANQRYAKQVKTEDDYTKIAINNALDNKEYFKGFQLYNNLHEKDAELLNKINIGWLPEKERLDKIYASYTKEYDLLKNEYYTSEKDFYIKYQSSIKSKDVTINGEEGYRKRILNTLDTTTKKFREKFINEHGYLYTKKENKHLISTVGIDANYNANYINNSCSNIIIDCKFDTLANTYYSTINYCRNDKMIFSGPILNTTTFNVKYFLLELPSDINNLYGNEKNDSFNNLLNTIYPKKIIWLNTQENISLANLQHVEEPPEGKKNQQYESLNSEFEFFNAYFNKFVSPEIKSYSVNFYNPSILYMVKKMYPEADKLVFAFGDYRSIDTLGIHFSSGGERSSILTLTKGLLEIKDDKLLIYDKSGNYSEIFVNTVPGSLINIKDIKIENLNLDSSFLFLKNYTYSGVYLNVHQYPLNYELLKLGYEDIYEKKQKYLAHFYINNNVCIKNIYLHKARVFADMEAIPFYFYRNENFVGEADRLEAKYMSSLRKYVSNYTNYLVHKQNGDESKATKYLIKANKYLDVFIDMYMSPIKNLIKD
jgi:hypothetical protein